MKTSEITSPLPTPVENAGSQPGAVAAAPGTLLYPHGTPPQAKVIIAVPPVFLTRKDSGEYLCASDDFLRINAKRHALYRPSVEHRGQGSACKYHREHLDIIARHLMDPLNYTEDMAYLAWRRRLANDIQSDLEAAKAPSKRSRA